MFCRRCGNEIGAGGNFCPACGVRSADSFQNQIPAAETVIEERTVKENPTGETVKERRSNAFAITSIVLGLVILMLSCWIGLGKLHGFLYVKMIEWQVQTGNSGLAFLSALLGLFGFAAQEIFTRLFCIFAPIISALSLAFGTVGFVKERKNKEEFKPKHMGWIVFAISCAIFIGSICLVVALEPEWVVEFWTR